MCGHVKAQYYCYVNVYHGRHISPFACSLSWSCWFCATVVSNLNCFSAGSHFIMCCMISSSQVISIGYGRFLLTYCTSDRAVNGVLDVILVITDSGLRRNPPVGLTDCGGSVVDVTCCCCSVIALRDFNAPVISWPAMLMVSEPPLGGVGNALRFCCVCSGGVVVMGW